MSVLIKDMDKPKACRDCPFMTGGWCRVWSDDETRLTDIAFALIGIIGFLLLIIGFLLFVIAARG